MQYVHYYLSQIFLAIFGSWLLVEFIDLGGGHPADFLKSVCLRWDVWCRDLKFKDIEAGKNTGTSSIAYMFNKD